MVGIVNEYLETRLQDAQRKVKRDINCNQLGNEDTAAEMSEENEFLGKTTVLRLEDPGGIENIDSRHRGMTRWQ